MDLKKLNIAKAGEYLEQIEVLPSGDELFKWQKFARKKIEPWLSALLQSEHLSLLLGSGSSIAAAYASGTTAQGMSQVSFGLPLEGRVLEEATRRAQKAGRGTANIEDQLTVALSLQEGLAIAGQTKEADEWRMSIDGVLTQFLQSILASERAMKTATDQKGMDLLASLILSCASRTTSRERLHILTTNYDRFIERIADTTGLHLIDRFVGSIEPVFRASRLRLDMHYSPPGMRGEPRLLEGVCHLSKVHGSLDWVVRKDNIVREPIAFGAEAGHPSIPKSPLGTVMIYPNAAKDRETAGYPFAELFRDMSAQLCQPNSTLVSYGYGFGDEHINRVMADMLTLPSTHICIVSYGDPVNKSDPHGRVRQFFEKVARPQQFTLLLGPHFADLETLVMNYLPNPALDPISFRRARLEKNRGYVVTDEEASDNGDDE
jgi:SIR2-like domain